MRRDIRGLSLVEIIIAIAIIVILTSIGVTGYRSATDRSHNSKILSDISTLQAGFLTYYNDTKLLPYPDGNLKIYNIAGGYEHSFEDEYAFGVSGFITQSIIPTSFISSVPLDPRNSQYYSYGYTKGYEGFQIAGVVVEDRVPYTRLTSHWEGRYSATGALYQPYLIKEYNGPNFVYDGAQDIFPYNPFEQKVTASIPNYAGSYSGSITINSETYTDSGAILSYIFGEGDRLAVEKGGYVDLYFSDGTQGVLGDTATGSEIYFEHMTYTGGTNLATSILLTLDAGTLWSKVVHLAKDSEYKVQTSDGMGAVRGTIFGVKKTNDATYIALQEGKIQVFNGNAYPAFVPGVTDQNGDMEVGKGEDPKGVKIDNSGSGSSNTGALNDIPPARKDEFTLYTPPDFTPQPSFEFPLCQAGYEPWYGECRKILEIDELDSNEQALFDLYEKILQRTPFYDEFQHWLSQIPTPLGNVDDIKSDFYSSYYFDYLNDLEPYFNSAYICEAQHSFKIDDICIENSLFKLDKNWELLATMPYDTDIDMYLSGTTITGSGSNLTHTGYYSYDSSDKIFTGSTFTDFANSGLKELPFEVKKLEGIDIYNWGGERGVLVNKADRGSIEYNSVPKFDAIELRVRSESLIERGDGHTLSLFAHNNQGGEYSYVKTNQITFTGLAPSLDIPLDGGDIEKYGFIKIVFACEREDLGKIYLLDDENNIIDWDEDDEMSGCFFDTNEPLFIGSNADDIPSDQWDDLIFGVKLYKHLPEDEGES